MSLLFMDSFQAYANEADMEQRGWVEAVTGAAFDTGVFKFGTQSLRLDGNAKFKTPDFTGQTTVYLSFYFYVADGLPSVARQVCYFVSDAGFETLSVFLNTDGSLQFKNALSSNIGPPSLTKLSVNTWYLIEVKAVLTDSSSPGDCIIRINESQAVDLGTGFDTKYSTSTTIDSVGFRGSGDLTKDFHFGGLIVFTGAGGNVNTYTGDFVIEMVKPSGNGNYSQFTGSDADSTDNYLHVDEAGFDDDTSYVQSGNAGDRDSYAYQDMSSEVEEILALQLVAVAKKDEADARTLKNFSRISSTDYDATATHTLVQDTYKGFVDILEDSPATATNWTKSEVAGAEFGVKIEA